METFNSIEKGTPKEIRKSLETSDDFKKIKNQIEDIENISKDDVLKYIEEFIMNGEHEQEEIDAAVDLLVKYRKEASEKLLGELHVA